VQLTDSSSTEIVQQIGAKARVTRLLPWAIVAGFAAVALLVYFAAPAWSVGVAALVALVVCVFARRRDVVARAVVLMYNLDDAAQQAYGRLHAAFESIQAAARVWHVNAAAVVRDRKYHAGASNVLNREAITVRKGEPPILKTNVEVVLLAAGRQLLAFLPDRLLIFERRGVASIDYKNLNLQVQQTRFIEDQAPPPDAKIVGTTWRYVNKSGGPDRRFANNPQLPIALYEEIHLQSASGLNELFQCSRLEVGNAVREAIEGIAKIANERKAAGDVIRITAPSGKQARTRLRSLPVRLLSK